MDFYMYKSTCPRWYGGYDDIRHVVVDKDTPENEVITVTKKISNNITGSKSCHVQLLQKYHMIIEAKKSYPALTGLRFHDTMCNREVNNIETIEHIEN